MPLVAFDSNICIWCIKEDCTKGQEQEMRKAITLRNVLTQAGYDILIPIPVVTELLSNVSDANERLTFYNEIKKTFQVGQFDEKAALILAEILNHHYHSTNRAYKQLGITKVPLKYDALLVALSKSAGAECLFAHDNDCKIIAAHFYSVKGLDERPDSINQNTGIFSQEEP
jgi:predicted nucleic acid-binding protein